MRFDQEEYIYNFSFNDNLKLTGADIWYLNYFYETNIKCFENNDACSVYAKNLSKGHHYYYPIGFYYYDQELIAKNLDYQVEFDYSSKFYIKINENLYYFLST